MKKQKNNFKYNDTNNNFFSKKTYENYSIKL